MIRASELIGRPVVDMEAATRIGKIKELILQRDGERVAGLIVSHGETIIGSGGTRRIIPASALHAIGPDAVTTHTVTEETSVQELDQLPQMSDVVGHKMVTQSGRLLGTIDDLLINGADGKVIGFAVGESVRSKLENVFNQDRPRVRGYVRAEADLQVGNDLIVVPDDALIEGEPATGETESRAVADETRETRSTGWGDSTASTRTPRRSIWTRRSNPPEAGSTKIPQDKMVEASSSSGGVAASQIDPATEEWSTRENPAPPPVER